MVTVVWAVSTNGLWGQILSLTANQQSKHWRHFVVTSRLECNVSDWHCISFSQSLYFWVRYQSECDICADGCGHQRQYSMILHLEQHFTIWWRSCFFRLFCVFDSWLECWTEHVDESCVALSCSCHWLSNTVCVDLLLMRQCYFSFDLLNYMHLRCQWTAVNKDNFLEILMFLFVFNALTLLAGRASDLYKLSVGLLMMI